MDRKRSTEGAEMIPSREKLIGENKMEEHIWYRQPTYQRIVIIYVNGRSVEETYDHAVARLEREA